jgi:hypothetical protein
MCGVETLNIVESFAKVVIHYVNLVLKGKMYIKVSVKIMLNMNSKWCHIGVGIL